MPKRAKKNASRDAIRSAAGINQSNKHITKISASNSHPDEKPVENPAEKPNASTADRPVGNPAEKSSESSSAETATIHKFSLKSKSEQKSAAKSAEKAEKVRQKSDKKSLENPDEKPLGDVFILARPFVALGRYFRDSWRELRQVRWPSRKAAWKLTFAVLAYCAVLMAFILVIDLIFTFIFETILK